MLLTILIFIIILGVLIFVHEFGHFMVAKRNGVRVEEFGFGFPPRIFSVKKGETIYSINAIPLGGFVKIYGEEGEGENSPRSFVTKKSWQKASILLAGVAMNIVLAIFLFGLGHLIGLPTAIDESDISKYPNASLKIVSVSSASPAAQAGILEGDSIISLKAADGKVFENIKKPSDFQTFVEAEKGKEITLILQRGSQEISVSLTPRENPPLGQGPTGVQLALVTNISSPWWRAPIDGFLTAIGLLWAIILVFFEIIKNIFSIGRVGVDLVGPVGIFNLTGQAQTMGFIYLMQLTALLSLNLAFINAFPFPALDGGRALFLVIEKIKGSPISQKVQNIIHSVGFAVLILLMIVITYRDILRFF